MHMVNIKVYTVCINCVKYGEGIFVLLYMTLKVNKCKNIFPIKFHYRNNTIIALNHTSTMMHTINHELYKIVSKGS